MTSHPPNRPPRIGQLSVYFGLFDEAMPPEFRQDREALANRFTKFLSAGGEVVYPGVVDSDEAGRRANEVFAREQVEVVVFVPAMAAPPSYGWEAISGLDVPVISVAAQELTSIPDVYTTEEGTQRSTLVGLVMFTNVMAREGKPMVTLVGRLESEEFAVKVAETVRAAALANRLRGARVGAIGPPIGGYLDVEATPEEVGRLGLEMVSISKEELDTAFAGAPDADVRELADGLRNRFETEQTSDEILHRSARLALALQDICQRNDLAGGTVNCHGDLFRWNPEVGITACLGVTCLTEAGTPLSCTGDLPAGIALTIGKAVAGGSLYCEIYGVDFEGDWVLLANGGESDVSMADPSRPVILLPEDHYMGVGGPGTAIVFSLPTGPATLLSMSPIAGAEGGWALVVGEGEIIGSRHEAIEGPNGMFRFASGPAPEAFQRFCNAGATHHSVLTPGHHHRTLRMMAEWMGFEVRAV
jgi:L-arabinose isomerase